jgi:hypothetical protein
MKGQTLRHRQQGTSRNLTRGEKDPVVEEALTQWFSIVSGRGVRVSGPVLKSKSEVSQKAGS